MAAMASCTSGWSIVWARITLRAGDMPGRQSGFGGLSRKAASSIRWWMASTRKPSTPRSSQKRSTSSMAARTSGLRQFRSGCCGR